MSETTAPRARLARFMYRGLQMTSARDFFPPRRSLAAARRVIDGCRGCALWENATQAVFGEGPAGARLMLVGEVPGDREDRVGEPFVGPAGRLLDRALEIAGIGRTEIYVTNVVKHFKWEQRGKRRIHAKPTAAEIGACLPWLEAELEAVGPEVLVCLGATAAQALLGRSFRVSTQRGRWVPARWAPRVLATVHPSAILRAPDDATRRAEMARFVADLALIPPVLGERRV